MYQKSQKLYFYSSDFFQIVVLIVIFSIKLIGISVLILSVS